MSALRIVLITTTLALAAQDTHKPIVYIPLNQAEYAFNLVKECPTVEVTWREDKAQLVISWDYTDGRSHWVLYTAEGKVIDAGETIKVSSSARDICKAATK